MTDQPDTITRTAGSWITDGFKTGATIVIQAPWYRRLWWALRRAVRWVMRRPAPDRHHGTFTVYEVTPTVIVVDEQVDHIEKKVRIP